MYYFLYTAFTLNLTVLASHVILLGDWSAQKM